MTGTVSSGAPSSSLTAGSTGTKSVSAPRTITTPPGWSERCRGGPPTPPAAGRGRGVPRRAPRGRRRPRQLEPARRQIEPRVVRVLGEQPVDRDVVAVPGDPPGHLADLARGGPLHLGHLAERAAGLEG